MNFKYIEMFHSIQGEGNVGKNIVFVRLAQCNFRCVWCDSKFTFNQGESLSFDDINNFMKISNCSNICFTGGEPLLQQNLIIEFIKQNPNYQYEIETNGSIEILDQLINNKNVLFNVSIKLKNSEVKNPKRINSDSINKFNKLQLYRIKFKFVIQNIQDLVEIKQIQKDHFIQNNKIYLMPEGISKNEQEFSQQKIIKLALEEGYNFSPRYHVLVWNTKRKV